MSTQREEAPMDADAIVIGAGQAAVPLAVRLAKSGRRTLLIERSRLGGTCVNYGCTPTKTMVASARAAHVARTSERLGVDCGSPRVDFKAILARKNAVVRRWREGIQARLDSAGDRLQVVNGHARFTGERQIEAGGERHRAEIFVIDVGVRPATPEVEGLAALPWLDNRRVMELDALPEHLVVIGGGYVGCEFAQMFRRFGAAVTVVQRGPHLLDREDPDVSEALEGAFRAESIDVILGAGVRRASPAGSGVAITLQDGRRIDGSHVLVAVGRRPNTDDLGCDRAGITLDARGFIKVDDRYRTSAEGIYAVGDVTGGPQFTHTAWDDHRILFEVLEGRPARSRSGRVIPYVVFTDPQVAGVGLNEREARARGVRFEVARMPFGQVARAIEIDETAGILKLLVDPQTERIVGANIVGAEAGELIHIFAALMQAGASARAVVDVEMAHPTFAEGVQSVAMQLPRYALG
jgi:pyruvate/2-oxoglutarate dehydrogenase complex dihydrolipoamide dehydrogenase (E3) component